MIKSPPKHVKDKNSFTPLMMDNQINGLLPHDAYYAKISSSENHNSKTFIPFNKQIKNFKNRTNNIRNKEISESEVIILALGNLIMNH